MTSEPDLYEAAPVPEPARLTYESNQPSARKGIWRTITFRILTLNIFALLILAGGLLYLDQFRDGLIAAKSNALGTQGKIIAAALGGAAIEGIEKTRALDAELTATLLRRMVKPTGNRARVFDANGALVVDSRQLQAAGREVQAQKLPLRLDLSLLEQTYEIIVNALAKVAPSKERYPPYAEKPLQKASDYSEVIAALGGEVSYLKRMSAEGLLITAAIPIQSFKRVQGTLLLSSGTSDIDAEVREFRLAILKVSGLALLFTILMSLYLANTIGKPMRMLATAAERVRRLHSRQVQIPDFTSRHDEIGHLSRALREMTAALYRRLDDIEAFAADVAHEIKNPLTSLRSAVEALEKIRDAGKQEKLIEVILQDVNRLDRLITDISDASRLDAELSRAQMKIINISELLETTVAIYSLDTEHSQLSLEIDDNHLLVDGIAERIAQVIRNILDNALSFSPKEKTIRMVAKSSPGFISVIVEDQGPGFAPKDLGRVFERFYTRRPEGEAFGRHSGLGLSISNQIMEAHGGKLIAENRLDDHGAVVGARVIVKLPLHAGKPPNKTIPQF